MTDPVEVVSQKTYPSTSYSASAITLYGVPLLGFDVFMGVIPYQAFITTVASASTTTPTPLQVVLIYGYTYQGHCYDLPEPMAVIVDTSNQQPAVGCGYGAPGIPGTAPFSPGTPYFMWQVDKLDRMVLIQTTNDTFEEVILKRNLIGAKQPLSYRSANQISHRGGKLTEFD